MKKGDIVYHDYRDDPGKIVGFTKSVGKEIAWVDFPFPKDLGNMTERVNCPPEDLRRVASPLKKR